MGGFCIDSFWDPSISWNNTWLQLTDCFQTSFLLPLPCFYLWLFLPFHIYLLCRRQPKEQKPLVGLLILKVICCVVMFAAVLISAVLDILRYQGDIHASLVFTDVLKLSSYILVTLTIILEHKKRARNSPGLLVFFILILLTHIVPFYTKIILQDHLFQGFSFAVFYIEYTAVLFSAVLQCFNTYIPDYKTSSPEESASVLSKLTLWWTTRLVIQGYRHPLTESDIYPLNKSEKAATVVPAFLSHLSPAVEKYHKKQREKPVPKLSHSTAKYARYADTDKQAHPPLIDSGELQSSLKQNFENGNSAFDGVTVEFKDSAKGKSDKRLGVFLWKVILHTFRKQLIKYCLMDLVVQACTLTGPLIVKLLIEFMSNDDEPNWHGYLLAVALFVGSTTGQVAFDFYIFQTNKFGINVKTALFSAVYRKTLCLSSEARQKLSSGEIIQLLSKDCDAIGHLSDEGFILVECPLELIIGLILVYRTVGVAMFAGLATLGVLIAIKAITTKKHAHYDRLLKKYADERMKIASQVFSGIKVLKLYAWEDAFKNRINAIRKKELAAIYKYDLFRFFITFAWTGAVFWMLFFTFLTHVLVDEQHHLKASTVFVTMAYFVYIRRSANLLAAVADIIISGVNSGQRVAKFLLLGEIEKKTVSPKSTISDGNAISISNGTFAWSTSGQPVLNNIHVNIPAGSLVAVVGMVGGGKSSLLSAILGEMIVHDGSIHKEGTIAYIPQEAWIQNDSLRNNILFGSDYREEDYQQVLEACALTTDLGILPSGDQTEIGEKGINLSGGQKQRVSLARAVYQRSDVYLLDDPLSAVDSHVGQHIFKHVIGRQGLLKDKTRILVTHGIHWLPEVDIILVMTDGHLTEQGSLVDLMNHNGPFAQFLSQFLTLQQQHQHKGEGDAGATDTPSRGHPRGSDCSPTPDIDPDTEKTGKDLFESLLSVESQRSDTADMEILGSNRNIHLNGDLSGADLSTQLSVADGEKDAGNETANLIEEEELATGRVEWSVYRTYIRSMGYLSMATLALLYFSYYCFDLTAGFWMTFWVDSPLLNNMSVSADSPLREQENNYYLGIYSLWGMLGTLVIVIFTNLKAWRHQYSCRTIHEDLITSVLACPVQFFDTTPVGRLLSRFSKDISVVDTTLLLWMEIWIHSVFAIVCAISAVIINIPVFLAAAVPVVLLFYIIQKFYLPTSCQLRRLERKCLAPVFSHASESFAGTSVIRALGEEDRFIRTAEEKIDFCQKMKYASCACERWLSIRLGLLSNLLVLGTGLLAVTFRSELTPGLTGLSLSLVLIITSEMQMQVRMASFMEMDIVSVERILQYTRLTPEAPRFLHCPEYSAEWPRSGDISFQDVCVRYRPGLDLVLKNVTFDIHDGEKIGVVGRTGAGKSSLMLALFRLIEPCQGKVVIDGLDISKLGLYELRQKLTILPQDPVLFSGSLRSNFDPFDQFTDDDVWKSIEHCHLKGFVATLAEGLDFVVGEGGDNLSVGQRQLICLGRALLRKTRILVLDEATAAVDVKTDELIQKTIRSEFESCTVLTIAHRLNTIMDYDRILVLDQGRIVEYDPPSVLLENSNSLFCQMVAQSQLVHTASS